MGSSRGVILLALALNVLERGGGAVSGCTSAKGAVRTGGLSMGSLPSRRICRSEERSGFGLRLMYVARFCESF